MSQSVLLVCLGLLGAECEMPPLRWLNKELAQSPWARRARCWRTGKKMQLAKDPHRSRPRCSACFEHRTATRELFDATESCLLSMPFICVLCCVRPDYIPCRNLPQWRRLAKLALATQEYCQAEGLGFNMSTAQWDVDADELGDDLLVLLCALVELKANYKIRLSYSRCRESVRRLVSGSLAANMARILRAPSTVMPLFSPLRCICQELSDDICWPTQVGRNRQH